MSPTAAKPRLGHVPRTGKLPIIFFGTIEVTWSSSKDVCSWAQGLKDDLWSKNKSKNRQLFDLGVEQVMQMGQTCKGHEKGTLLLMAGNPCSYSFEHPDCIFVLPMYMLMAAAYTGCSPHSSLQPPCRPPSEVQPLPRSFEPVAVLLLW